MNNFGQIPTGGDTEFGNDPGERICNNFRLRLDLFVKYERNADALNSIPIDVDDWGGEVKLKATFHRIPFSIYDCDVVGHIDYSNRCPIRCKYMLKQNSFTGKICGLDNNPDIGLTNDLGEFIAAKKCSPYVSKDQMCPLDLPPQVGANAHKYCWGENKIVCLKDWVTCDPEDDLVKYFGLKKGTGEDQATKSIDMSQVPGLNSDEDNAMAAYKTLETINEYNKSAGKGFVKECYICEYLCCLLKAMVHKDDGGSGEVGCNKEECELAGVLAAPFGWPWSEWCEHQCGMKWTDFLLKGPCSTGETSSGAEFSMLDNGDGSCPGCCGEGGTLF